MLGKHNLIKLRSMLNPKFPSFNMEKISEVMGDNKRSIYITMIRDPVDIFISAYYYYNLGKKHYKMSLCKRIGKGS